MTEKELAKTLYELRMKYDVRLDEVAHYLNVPIGEVNDWELGTSRPTEEQLQRLVLLYDSLDRRAHTHGTLRDTVFTESKNKKVNKAKATKLMNKMMGYVTEGEDSGISLTLKDVIKGTFRFHSRKEYQKKGYLAPGEVSLDSWIRPWLYFWVMLVGIIVFTIAYFSTENILTLVILGTIPIPITLVVFVWEVNIYKNIKPSRTLLFVLIGGATSIVITMVMNSLISNSGALLVVGFIEETAKLLTSYYFLKKHNVHRVLPAVVIGASVGAGFAMIESAMYAMNYYETSGFAAAVSVIITRAFCAFGTHIIWAAFSASALSMVAKDRNYHLSLILNGRFIRLFIIPIGLHFLWNTCATYIPTLLLNSIALIIIAAVGFMLLWVMINVGIKQFNADATERMRAFSYINDTGDDSDDNIF